MLAHFWSVSSPLLEMKPLKMGLYLTHLVPAAPNTMFCRYNAQRGREFQWPEFQGELFLMRQAD